MGSELNSGDIAWILTSSSFVMMMTPAVGFFYGGMVRRKNLLSTMMMCFTVLILITLQWVYFGYTLTFGPDVGHIIGDLSWFGLQTVRPDEANTNYAATIPHMAFMLFQMKFAIITPALIIGAFVERIRFSTFLIFTLLWTTLVYDPIAHWVWAVGGWLRNLGALDFAGGTVVHITAGVAALALSLVIRPRKNYGEVEFEPYSIPLMLLGTVILWFGWFGFNGGSALAANGLATHAIITSNVGAAAAALTWLLIGLKNGRPSIVGVATGAVVGLVAITPACGFVDINAAFIIGVVGAMVSYYCIQLKNKLKLDDTLDVWACHGMAGTWGAIATGLFASKTINPAGADGLIFGNWGLFQAQIISVLVAWGWAFVMTYAIAKAISIFKPLTVRPAEEELGLDIAQHGEEAYAAL